MKYSIILLLSFYLEASDCFDQEISPPLKKINILANKLERKVNHFAATSKDVDSALCVKKDRFSPKEIENYLNSFEGPNVTRKFNGIQITDTPRKIQLLRKLLTNHHTKFDKEIDDFDEEVLKKCSTVDCVLTNTFGKEVNTYLYVLDKYGINLNSNRMKYTSHWSTKELDGIKTAINYIPDMFLKLNKNQSLVRTKRGHDMGENYANGKISIHDKFYELTPQMQIYNIYHELGHNISELFLKLDNSKEWLNASGWKESTVIPGEHFTVNAYSEPSKYSTANPYEDFAETFSAYRFSPKRLKSSFPKRYEFMKKHVYAGVEYLTQEKCQKEQHQIYNYISSSTLKAPNKISNISSCKEEIIHLINDELTSKKLKTCAKKIAIYHLAEQKISKTLGITDREKFAIINENVIDLNQFSMTDEEVDKVRLLLAETVMNSFMNNYSKYSSKPEYQNQKLSDLKEKLKYEKNFFHDNKQKINLSLLNINQNFQNMNPDTNKMPCDQKTKDLFRYMIKNIKIDKNRLNQSDECHF